jgi:hypothetical protein
MGKPYTTAELADLYRKYEAIAKEQGKTVSAVMTSGNHKWETFEKAKRAASGEAVGVDAKINAILQRHESLLRRRDEMKRLNPNMTFAEVNEALGITKRQADGAMGFVNKYRSKQDDSATMLRDFARGYYSVWTKHEDTQLHMKCAGWFSAKRDALKFVDDRLFHCLKVQIVCPKGKVVA